MILLKVEIQKWWVSRFKLYYSLWQHIWSGFWKHCLVPFAFECFFFDFLAFIFHRLLPTDEDPPHRAMSSFVRVGIVEQYGCLYSSHQIRIEGKSKIITMKEEEHNLFWIHSTLLVVSHTKSWKSNQTLQRSFLSSSREPKGIYPYSLPYHRVTSQSQCIHHSTSNDSPPFSPNP
jgi:hypothetical protein